MTEMTAHPADERLADLAADVLAPHDAGPVRAHVDRCATCTGVVRALSDVGDALQALPEPPLPVGLHDRVLEAVHHAGDPLVGAGHGTTPRRDVVAVPPLSPAAGESGMGDVASTNADPGIRRQGAVRARRVRTSRDWRRWSPLLGAAAALLLLAVIGLGQLTEAGVRTTAGPPPAPEAGPRAAPQDDPQREPEGDPANVPDGTSEATAREDVPPETVPGEAPEAGAEQERTDGKPSGPAPLGGLPVFAADPGPVSPNTVLQSIERRSELTQAYETALNAGAVRNEGTGADPSLASCPGVAESGGTPAFFLTSEGAEPTTTLVVVLPGGDVLLFDATSDGCVGRPDAGGGAAPGSN